MRKTILIIALNIAAFVLVSCSDNLENLIKDDVIVLDEQFLNGYVYPLSNTYQAMYSATRSEEISFETDWENRSFVYTYSGAKVDLPWASVTDSNLPLDIAMDVKKKDGWQMLLHTFANAPSANKDKNYMILYNIRTGVLKVFYYLESIPQFNNTGIWELSFTNSHQMFNAMRDFTFPVGMENNTHWGGTNFVTNKTKGFLRGWNCFQTVLTYDPNENTNNRYLEIVTHNLNSADVDLFGDFQGYSTGTIITHGNRGVLQNINPKLSTLVGKEAERWIVDNMGMVKGQTLKSALLAGGASAIVKKGLHKLFSNFTATLKKPTETISDLQFTTKTTGNINGDFTFNSSSPVMGLRALFSEDMIGGKLGTWNLAAVPHIYIDPRAGLVNEGHTWADDASYRFFGSCTYDYNVVINPRLTPYIIQKSISHELVSENYVDFPYQTFDCGNLGSIDPIDGWFKIYKDKPNKFQSKVGVHGLKQKYGKLPPAICIDDERIDQGRKFSLKEANLRITVQLITEIEGQRDTTISTRTYIPKIEWEPTYYSSFKGYDFSQFEWYSCPPEIYQYEDN